MTNFNIINSSGEIQRRNQSLNAARGYFSKFEGRDFDVRPNGYGAFVLWTRDLTGKWEHKNRVSYARSMEEAEAELIIPAITTHSTIMGQHVAIAA